MMGLNFIHVRKKTPDVYESLDWIANFISDRDQSSTDKICDIELQCRKHFRSFGIRLE